MRNSRPFSLARFAPALLTPIFIVLLSWLALWQPAASAAPASQEGAPRSPAVALTAAAEWLVATHQNSDGGFTSFSTGANNAPSDVGGTVDALLALAATDRDVSAQIAYLTADAEAVAAYAGQDGSTAGKLALALAAADEDPGDFGGQNYVVRLTEHLSPTGQYGVTNAFNQALALLGLAAAGESAPETAVAWLTGLQATEGDLAGSWDDGFGTAGNADATAMAVLALLRGGFDPSDPAIQTALDFLSRTQLASGGWEYGAGFGENANSTALVIQALAVAGEDLDSQDGRWSKGGRTPIDALLSWQSASGAFQADLGSGRADDFFATVQAIPALAAATAASSEGVSGPAIASGNSPLPYIVIGLVAWLVFAAAVAYLKKDRSS